LGEKRSFLFLLGSRSFDSFVLPERGQIEAVARAVYEGLQQNRQEILRPQMQLVSGKLSDLLLPPVVRNSGKRRLVIVADGQLHYIPFAALPVLTSNGEPGPLLIDKFQLVYLPSVAALGEMRRRQIEY